MMLSLDTAYRSFGGEVEASSTPTICRLSDSPRHQLSAIAPPGEGRTNVVNYLENRKAGQARRIANALSEGFEAPETAAERRLTQARDNAADAEIGGRQRRREARR